MTESAPAAEPGAQPDAASGPLSAFVNDQSFQELERAAELAAAGAHVSLGNLWGAAQPYMLAALAHGPHEHRSAFSGRPWLALAASEGEAELLTADLEAFGVMATLFPARESYARKDSAVHADVEVLRARLEVAQCLAGPASERPRVLVGSVLAFTQPIPSMKALEKEFLTLTVGAVLDPKDLMTHLIRVGYERQPLAESPGEVSLRGDILDVFPFASQLPLRIELFEDEIESLRTFEPADQRSVESHESIQVCLASEASAMGDEGVLVPELFAPDTFYVTVEPLRVVERAESLAVQSPALGRAWKRFGVLRSEHASIDLQSLPGDDLNFDTRSIQALGVGMKRAASSLREVVKDGTRVVVLCQNQADERRFGELLAEQGGVGEGLETRVASLSRGFSVPALGLVFLNHRELKGIAGARRRAGPKAAHRVKALQSFFELKRRDLVVHAVHGLARFMGLENLARGGGEEEHLHLRFAGDVSLFVPASRIDLVHRYIGTGGSSEPPLDRIGAATFRKRKEKVERNLFDLAAELIEVQAKRAMKERASWRADEELVQELIGEFPYEDTADQSTVDRELAKDLYGPRPMDRMICGDVGFGKTELAVRAAFRVVNGGGQVAVLVPTTVLAQQHYETFAERMADFPVEVAVVSRYVKPKAITETLERAREGRVDVLVGTHRILSKDVEFKRLGLVVVDEEQRFGVQHKEHFKKLRASVDILTMTATPIPRTLHMSLSGLRDISALTVPPPGRQEIETVLVYKDDEDAIRSALLREKNRDGQAFFLHNRVSSIESVAAQLARLAPSCSFAIGHGQMSSTELHTVMDDFTQGAADVLVATTIIENGLDIPSAGTILIDDADRFGLSELHQLRGRVGRGAHKAYCYLLVERHKPLQDIARERLKALEEMNHLGAGFGISVKDLELRGAGNLLGAEQSGHIAAVGYDMFCRLLRQTIERIKAGESFDKGAPRVEEREVGVELELGLRAFLPVEWIPDADTRLELARELATITTEEDALRVEGMLRDRFGRLPDEALELLRLFRLKARLDPYRLRRVAFRDGVYLIEYEDRVALERLLRPALAGGRVELRRIKSGLAHLVIPPDRDSAEAALVWFEELLKDLPREPTIPAEDEDTP